MNIGINISGNSMVTGMSIGLDLFGFAVMIILMHMCKRTFNDSQDMRYLRATIFSIAIVMLSDIGAWVFNGGTTEFARIALLVSTEIYDFMQIVAVVLWARYVYQKVKGHSMSRKRRIVSVLGPFVIIGIIMTVNVFTGIVFGIDENNLYVRGPLNVIIALLVVVYIGGISGWALNRRSKEVTYDKREAYRALAVFVVLPMIGGVLQYSFFGLSLIWPLAALSMIIFFVRQTQFAISLDALTGLNNRGRLDLYLNGHILNNPSKRCVLVLLDVDKFKHINDTLGHDEGDVALKKIAEGMKLAFKGDDVFLSRYGGDEFVAIFPDQDKASVDSKIVDFKSFIKRANESSARSIPLSVSIGSAVLPDVNVTTTDEFIRAADQAMYKEKRANA